MRKLTLLAIAAATVSLAGVASLSIASADANGGGPVIRAGMCWVSNNALDLGYWKPCDAPMMHHHHHHHHG
jgi:hypothetical protein